MKPELEEALFAIEPNWFDRERSAMTFGFECGDGWFPLLKGLLELAKEKQLKPDQFAIRQVIEKRGALKVYCAGTRTAAYLDFLVAVSEAEKASLKVCEICGAPGELGMFKRYKQKTLCEEHKNAVSKHWLLR